MVGNDIQKVYSYKITASCLSHIHSPANLCNNHFQSQTILNEQSATSQAYHTQLNSIILTPLGIDSPNIEVEKASVPSGLNNYILCELSSQFASPFGSLFNQSLHLGIMSAILHGSKCMPSF